jgi:hypothetical protein
MARIHRALLACVIVLSACGGGGDDAPAPTPTPPPPGPVITGFTSGGVTGLLSSQVTETTELLGAGGARRDGPSMGIPRRDHTVTRLNSGKLLIVGGLGTNVVPIASAEIYE